MSDFSESNPPKTTTDKLVYIGERVNENAELTQAKFREVYEYLDVCRSYNRGFRLSRNPRRIRRALLRFLQRILS